MKNGKPLLFLAFFLFLSGCAASGPLYLYPEKHRATGYHQSGERSVFENVSVKISLERIKGLSEREKNPVIQKLLDENFVLLGMDIENRSGHKIIYTPSHTSLITGAMGYEKPVDYTELYYILRGKGEEAAAETQIASLRGKFYDSNTQVFPGEKVSKILIFKPLEKDTTGGSATLTIKELYVGTDTIDLAFPFSVRADKK